MRSVVEHLRSPSWSRIAIFGVIAVAAVSCSSDSSRFTMTDPFGSKARTGSRGEVTGSVSNPAPKPSTVQSKPLPPPPVAGTIQAPETRPAGAPAAGGAKGMASYQPGPAKTKTEVTGTVPAPQSRGWTWEGGTPVMVGPNENGQTLAQRYGVPATAIAQANGLPDAAAIKPGQRLVIPRYDTTASATSSRPAASAPAKPAPAIAAPATAPATTSSTAYVHTIAPGETLMKLSRQYKKPLNQIAAANNIPPHTQVKVGDRIIIPGLRAPQQQVAQTPPPVVQQPQTKPAVVAANNTPSTARAITPANESPVVEKTKADATAVVPSFRWPVRGRVITGFGPKPSGQQNDGINVAVPEGTPIKAAEDGVVAYAGNELKTYGNLVLIRHSNGYVTAYAHASEILVKRDEPIKRGQVIAKSGQTGNVAAPQLHFEIRKGSSPVDPMPFLDKGGST